LLIIFNLNKDAKVQNIGKRKIHSGEIIRQNLKGDA